MGRRKSQTKAPPQLSTALVAAFALLVIVCTVLAVRSFGLLSTPLLMRTNPGLLPSVPTARNQQHVVRSSCGETRFDEELVWQAGVDSVDGRAFSKSDSQEASGLTMNHIWTMYASRYASGASIAADGRQRYMGSGATIMKELETIMQEALPAHPFSEASGSGGPSPAVGAGALVLGCELGRVAAALAGGTHQRSSSSKPADTDSSASRAVLPLPLGSPVICIHRTMEEMLVAAREMQAQAPPVPALVSHVVSPGPWVSRRLARGVVGDGFGAVLSVEPFQMRQPPAWQAATAREACRLVRRDGAGVVAFAADVSAPTSRRPDAADCEALALPPSATGPVVRMSAKELQRHVEAEGCAILSIVELPRHSIAVDSASTRDPVVVKAVVFSKNA